MYTNAVLLVVLLALSLLYSFLGWDLVEHSFRQIVLNLVHLAAGDISRQGSWVSLGLALPSCSYIEGLPKDWLEARRWGQKR